MQALVTQVVPILSLVISILALSSVYFAWKRIDQSNKWNKIKAATDFIDAHRADELIDKVDTELTRLGLNPRANFSTEEVEKIYADPLAQKAVHRYLTYLERLAAAVNIGAIDDELAYQFTVCEVLGAQLQYAEYARLGRVQGNDNEQMMELEKLALRWRETKSSTRKQMESFRHMELQNSGLRRKV